MQLANRYCPNCREQTAALYCGPNHVLHAIITFLFCGLWAPVWLCLAAFGGSWRCQKCGSAVRGEGGAAGAVALLLILGVGGAAVFLGILFIGVLGRALHRGPDPVRAGMEEGKKAAAEEWDKRVAEQQARAAEQPRRDPNYAVAAQRRRLQEPADGGPAAEEPPAAEPRSPDLDGPETITAPDGGRAREREKRAAEAKAAAQARDDEAKAAALLKAAKPLLPVNKKAAQRRLQEIIDKYPDTEAAAEARKLLK